MKFPCAVATACLVFVSMASGQTPAKQAKIERMMQLAHIDSIMDQMFNQIKAAAVAQVPPGTTPEERAKAEEIQGKIMNLVKSRMSWEKMKPLYLKLYSDTFTDQEIDGIVAFYESPAGQSMLTKMPVLMTKGIQIGQDAMKDTMPEIQRIVKEAQEGK